MTLRAAFALLLTLAALLAVWVLRAELTHVRGTLAWDMRLVLVGIGVLVFLSLAETIAGRAAPSADAGPPDA